MRKPMKAALLSALVFPGLGHIYLKKFLPGAALIAAAIFPLYYIISESVQKAQQVLEKIQTGNGPVDSAQVAAMLNELMTPEDAQMQQIAATALFVIWLLGIISAYRAGRGQDKPSPDETV